MGSKQALNEIHLGTDAKKKTDLVVKIQGQLLAQAHKTVVTRRATTEPTTKLSQSHPSISTTTGEPHDDERWAI